MHVQTFGALDDVILIAGFGQKVGKHLMCTALAQHHFLSIEYFLYPKELSVDVLDIAQSSSRSDGNSRISIHQDLATKVPAPIFQSAAQTQSGFRSRDESIELCLPTAQSDRSLTLAVGCHCAHTEAQCASRSGLV